MNVHLRYFAILRERLGKSSETRAVPTGTTSGDLLAELQSALDGAALPRMMVMVNHSYVDADHQLQDGDEVAFIPPVSGGQIADVAERQDLFRVTNDILSPTVIELHVADPGAGGTVTFVGTVRNTARGKDVVALDYEAYAPAAERSFAQIAGEIRARWQVARIAIVHRTGYLAVGEASVVIAISSAHREEAFAASRYAIERLKEIAPIWKKEHYANGAIWVGSEAEYQQQTRQKNPTV